jgi:PKD repeat protein
MVDLNDLVDAPGWILTDASAINEDGDIVGIGVKDGESRGFLLVADGAIVPPTPGNEPPVAVANADVRRGRAPLTVRFDASGSSDPEGLALSYHWDFGDGTTSDEPDPSHSYDVKGTYFVVLTVTDEGGLGASDSLEISVRRPRGGKK